MPESDNVQLGFLPRLVSHKYYIDELYNAVITRPLDKIADFTYRYIEVGFIDKTINGAGVLLNRTSSLLKNLQTGNIGFYIFSMVIGIILLLVLNLVI